MTLLVGSLTSTRNVGPGPSTNYQQVYSSFVAGLSGTATTMSFKCWYVDAVASYVMAIYDSAKNLLGYTSPVAPTVATKTAALVSSVPIVAGNTYWLSLMETTTGKNVYASTNGSADLMPGQNATTYAPPPSTIDTTPTFNNLGVLSISADGTVAGGVVDQFQKSQTSGGMGEMHGGMRG